MLLKKLWIIFKITIITAAIIGSPIILSAYLSGGNLFISAIGFAIGTTLFYPVMLFYVEPKIRTYIESLPGHTSY